MKIAHLSTKNLPKDCSATHLCLSLNYVMLSLSGSSDDAVLKQCNPKQSLNASIIKFVSTWNWNYPVSISMLIIKTYDFD